MYKFSNLQFIVLFLYGLKLPLVHDLGWQM